MENLLVFYSISIQIRFGVSKDKADLVYIQTFVMSIQNTYYFYTQYKHSLNTYHVPNARRNLGKSSKACLH